MLVGNFAWDKDLDWKMWKKKVGFLPMSKNRKMGEDTTWCSQKVIAGLKHVYVFHPTSIWDGWKGSDARNEEGNCWGKSKGKAVKLFRKMQENILKIQDFSEVTSGNNHDTIVKWYESMPSKVVHPRHLSSFVLVINIDIHVCTKLICMKYRW